MRKMATVSVLASLLLALTAASVAAQGAGFVLDPSAKAVFNDLDTFVPVEYLDTVDDDPASLSVEERAANLSAISVTPNGDVYRLTVTPEDLRIFEEAISAFSGSYQPVPPGLGSHKATGTGPAADLGFLREKSVIGTDERVRVTATTVWPWRTMGRVDVGCTGTVVGPRHIITAGHCVYNIYTDTWYTNLNFSPAQNGGSKPFGTYTWYAAISVSGWVNSHNRNYDYAMIVTYSNLGYTTGYMSYGYDNGLSVGTIVNINGYPADKPSGTMWHSDCPLTITQTYRLYYECDTYNGMSGSSVYVYWPPSTRIIYGIHAYGVDSTGDNGATRINSAVFYNFNSWRNMFPPAY